MAKKKKGSAKKFLKSMKYWFVADENGRVNNTARIAFEFFVLLPFVIFEGVKIGFYSKLSLAPTGVETFADGLATPFWEVYEMKYATPATGFGNQYAGFDPGYLSLMLLAFITVFAISYMTAERNKNKSVNKDGDMKFGSIPEFNETMAYCDKDGEPIEPEENSYEPGNMILSKNVRYSLEPKGTNTYSCALVIGATGCGKTFTYVKPNILQMNSSYVVTDPKGELTSDLGAALMRHGYNVKVFNINEPEYSCKYNPFHYIRKEEDVVTAVNVFLENTKEQDAGGGDPFFPLAEKNFYLGLFFYIYTVYKDEPEKQNFKTLYELFQSADEQEVMLKKGEAAPETEFDKLFRDLAKKDPSNPSLGYYATFKKGSFKTRQSILTSVGVKMWFLSVGSVANLMSGDTLELEKLGDRKTALFVIIPSEKDTYKFLSAMLFTQLFETLYYVGNTLNEKSFFVQKGNCVALRSEPFIAGTESEDRVRIALETKRELWSRATIEDDEELMKTDKELEKYFNTPNAAGFKPFPKARLVYVDPKTKEKRVLEEFQSRAAAEMVYDAVCNGEIVRGKKSLTNHVRFMLDEFFSLGKIPGFDLKIATFRSLRISCDIIIQSISQLRELYEDREGKITNNCSIQILLGAASMDDCQYFSDLIGQTTVRSESVSVNHKGLTQGVDSTSLSDNAQLLLRPEKIRTLNKDRCLILVNTKMPLWDDKYSSLEHPRWKETYSSSDPDSIKNQFQFRRLFFIEQDDSNRVVTILKDPVQPTIGTGSNTNKIAPKNTIKGKPISNPKIGLDPVAMSEEERFKSYENQKKKQANINAELENKDAIQNVQNTMKRKTNEYGEIRMADLSSANINAEAILLAAASGDGWEVTSGDTPNTKRLQPTKDNALANALKNSCNIKKEQIVTSEDDMYDSIDLW